MPTASRPGATTPTSTRGRRPRSSSRRSRRPTTCCPTPTRSRPTTTAPTPTARVPPGSARASRSATSWTPSSAARPAPRAAGRARAPARGQDALVRLDIDLGDAVFGAQKDLTIDTAVACSTCRGAGTQPGTSTPDLRRLRRPRRDPAGAAQLPRPGHDHPPVHDLPGLRPGPHRPLLRVLRRRAGAHPPHPQAQGARRASTPAPASSSPARARSAHGGGPAGDLYVEVAVSRAPDLPAPRRRPALHRRAADDRRGARHDAASSRPSTAPSDLEIRRGTQRGDAITLRGLGSPTCAAPVAATSSCTPWCRRRPGSTPSRRSCCASSPTAARRGAPRGPARPRRQGPASASCATPSRQ